MRVLTILVVLLLALVGAGCGGGDDEAASDEPDETLTTETDTETTDETTTDDTDTSGLASEECQELINASAAFSQALGQAGTSEDDPEEVQRVFEEYAEQAPEEIQADIRILGEAYAEYAEVLTDVDLEPGETPDAETITRLQEALASINVAEVTAASERLSAWATANC